MQLKSNNKYIILFSILLSVSISAFSQENTSVSDTAFVSGDTVSLQKKNKIFNFFKRKDKKKDTSEVKKKKTFFPKNIFKKKNKKDSALSVNDSITSDSLLNDTSSLNQENDSISNKKSLEKPQRITPGLWLKLNAEQQDSLLKAWDDYDRQFYVKKYKTPDYIKKIDMKREKSSLDKFILKHRRDNVYKYRKKLINRRISRYKKTMRYDRLKKSDTAPDDSISDKKKYQTVNKKFKREAKQEAIRKNKVILKYDKKEERLRRKYKLTENEVKILNKGKGMRLKGSEKIIFNKALKKQQKFTEKLLKLRRKRSFALQNKEMQKKMKEDKKRIAKRDKEINKKRNKKPANKNNNKKHDSSEYPKRYFPG